MGATGGGRSCGNQRQTGKGHTNRDSAFVAQVGGRQGTPLAPARHAFCWGRPSLFPPPTGAPLLGRVTRYPPFPGPVLVCSFVSILSFLSRQHLAL